MSARLQEHWILYVLLLRVDARAATVGVKSTETGIRPGVERSSIVTFFVP